MTDEQLLTVREVTTTLKIGRTKLYELFRTQELPSLTIGRNRRIPARAVRAYLTARTELGEAA